jgi:transposase
MTLIAVGLDVAKSIFQVRGVAAHGRSPLRKQLRRSEVLRFFANLAKSNQIRSMFAEEGVVFPVSITHLRRSVSNAVGDPRSAITPILRRLGTMYLEQLAALERWLAELNEQLHQIATEREDCKLLTSIPGITQSWLQH